MVVDSTDLLTGRDINRWLSSTDPSSNHNTASQKRVPSTGHWFLNHPEFLKWQSAPNSMLWLNGIRKSIYLSTSFLGQ